MVYQRPVVYETPLPRQEEIRETIESKGVNLTPCFLCHHDKIKIFETGLRIGVRVKSKNWPERFFSTAVIICDNCGHKSEFDGETLGRDQHRTDTLG